MTEFHSETVKCKPAKEPPPHSLDFAAPLLHFESSQFMSSFMLLNHSLLTVAWTKRTEVLLIMQRLSNKPHKDHTPLRFFYFRAGKGGASLRPIWVTRANVAKHVRPSGEANNLSPARAAGGTTKQRNDSFHRAGIPEFSLFFF